MARFCPVVPSRMIMPMGRDGILGNSHLLLAHDVAEDRHYRVYFNEHVPDAAVDLFIMDNSVVELGTAKLLPTMQKALDSFDRQRVIAVLPDVLKDGPATVTATWAAYQDWLQMAKDMCAELMVVPQGKDWYEWAACAEELAYLNYVNWWGIPRNLVEVCGTRRKAVELASFLNPHRKIHMLGFSDDLSDDMLTARKYPSVRSIDSAVPIRAASLGLEFSLSLKIPPRGDWWDTGVYNSELTIKNVRRAREMFGN
jgi:hypothetical protein